LGPSNVERIQGQQLVDLEQKRPLSYLQISTDVYETAFERDK